MSHGDRPPLPRLPKRGKKASSPEGATFLALAGVTLVVFGLIALVSIVLPAELRVVILLIGFVAGFFGGHYLLWGRWLERRLRKSGGEAPLEFWKHAAPTVPLEPDEGE
jgi:hypothetical protein